MLINPGDLIGGLLAALREAAAAVKSLPSFVGLVGGTVGIISGVAVFARRRLRIVVTVTRNNDAHFAWHTINIANRSDLTLSYRDFAMAWFVWTPLGRLRLNWAYCPEDETDVKMLAPHGTDTFRLDDEVWSLAMPKERRESAFLRIYLHLPSRGRGVWLPVRMTKWRDDSLRTRLLKRLYVKKDRSDFDDIP